MKRAVFTILLTSCSANIVSSDALTQNLNVSQIPNAPRPEVDPTLTAPIARTPTIEVDTQEPGACSPDLPYCPPNFMGPPIPPIAPPINVEGPGVFQASPPGICPYAGPNFNWFCGCDIINGFDRFSPNVGCCLTNYEPTPEAPGGYCGQTTDSCGNIVQSQSCYGGQTAAGEPVICPVRKDDPLTACCIGPSCLSSP